MSRRLLSFWSRFVPQNLRSWIRNSPWIYGLLERIDFFVLYRSFWPQKIFFEETGTSISVDFKERRGRALLRSRARGQWYLKEKWLDAIEKMQPDLVIDVGANYGEFAFLPRFAEHTAVIALEANPKLMPWLEQSLASHPDRKKISLMQGIVGKKMGGTATLHIDPGWSGRSSAVQHNESGIQCEVDMVSIDGIVTKLNIGKPKKLVFKIDVEGYEEDVFAGMQSTLKSADSVFGLIEFDCSLLRNANTDPVNLARALSQNRLMYYLDKKRVFKKFELPGDEKLIADDWSTEFMVFSSDLVINI